MIDAVKQLEPGERLEMPVRNTWRGANQALFQELCTYAKESGKAFEVENEQVDPANKNKFRFWIVRKR